MSASVTALFVYASLTCKSVVNVVRGSLPELFELFYASYYICHETGISLLYQLVQCLHVSHTVSWCHVFTWIICHRVTTYLKHPEMSQVAWRIYQKPGKAGSRGKSVNVSAVLLLHEIEILDQSDEINRGLTWSGKVLQIIW